MEKVDQNTEAKLVVQALRINTMSKLTFSDSMRFDALPSERLCFLVRITANFLIVKNIKYVAPSFWLVTDTIYSTKNKVLSTFNWEKCVLNFLAKKIPTFSYFLMKIPTFSYL